MKCTQTQIIAKILKNGNMYQQFAHILESEFEFEYLRKLTVTLTWAEFYSIYYGLFTISK